MEVRRYLETLWRRSVLLLLGALVVGGLAYLWSSNQDEVYAASARVLLRPNDPTQQLNPQDVAYSDPDRYVSSQIQLIESLSVTREALETLGDEDVDDDALLEALGQVSASQEGFTDVIVITARDEDPERARALANAFTAAYIENRREVAVAGLERVAAEIDDRLEEIEDRLRELDDAESVSTASRQAASLQYQSLSDRRNEVMVSASLQRGDAEPIDEAIAPQAPVSPRPRRDAILGFVAGILLAAGLVVLREQFQDRIRSIAEFEEISGRPVVGRVPLDRTSARKRNYLLAMAAPRSQAAEAIRAVRTSMQFYATERDFRKLLFTSPEPGDGKTHVAANVACAYAQGGMRTVLVSGDLRRPRMDALFGVPSGLRGFSELLALPEGQVTASLVNDALVATKVDNLWLLPSGAVPANPAELLLSASSERVLERLAEAFDVVIVDSPPANAVTDPVLLANGVDCIVLVCSHNGTGRRALERAVIELSATRTRVLGLIINKGPADQSAYYADPESRSAAGKVA